jgi:hypothetical protein
MNVSEDVARFRHFGLLSVLIRVISLILSSVEMLGNTYFDDFLSFSVVSFQSGPTAL